MKDKKPDMDERVRSWLEGHPDFFARHPELLPHALEASGKVIRLEDGQLEHLRRQNDQVRLQLDAMLDRIQHNERIYHAFHAIQVEMVNAPGLDRLVRSTARHLEESFDITRVTVSLGHALLTTLKATPPPEGEDPRLFVLEQSVLEKIMGTSGRTVIRIGLEGVERERYFADNSANIRSEALVPLMDPGSEGRSLIGSLNLGGATPSRFLPSLSTDLLQNMATIFALCVKNLLLAHRW